MNKKYHIINIFLKKRKKKSVWVKSGSSTLFQPENGTLDEQIITLK